MNGFYRYLESSPANPSSVLDLHGRLTGEATVSGSSPRIAYSSFLPDDMSTAAPGTLLYHDDITVPGPLDPAHKKRDAEMQEVIDRFQDAYPDIIFEADWTSDEVNAGSWIDENGQKHVQVLGGILHSTYIGPEGLALVLAHEVGHLEGGAPYHQGRTALHPRGVPSKVYSSEGQADYYGASVVMRNMSNQYGFDYNSVMDSAISQLHNLFHYGIDGATSTCTYPPDRSGYCQCASYFGCDYPGVDHRIETYVAAENGKAKPVCAGPTISSASNLLDSLLNSVLLEIRG